MELEETVRANGAIPITIGILNGKAIIGMSKDEIKELCESAGSGKTVKVSRRDIPYILGQTGSPLNGGTTIAGTLALASAFRLKILATGGLGGVHKGAETTMDISADLSELSRTPMAVISSGIKSFLDVPRTLEYLETLGVFVSTFGTKGQKVNVPGFLSHDSGYPSPNVVESAEEAAKIARVIWSGDLGSGALFFNPIPEEWEIPRTVMDEIVSTAVDEAKDIIGKDNTPYILKKIEEKTGGSSLDANRKLILSNAKIGAEMAVAVHNDWSADQEAVNAHWREQQSKDERKSSYWTDKKSGKKRW